MKNTIKRLNPRHFFHDPQWIWLLGDSDTNLFSFDFEGYRAEVNRSQTGIHIRNGTLRLVLRLPFQVWVENTSDCANVDEFFVDPADPTEEEVESFFMCHPKLRHSLEELVRVYHKIIGQMRVNAHLRAFKNNQVEAMKNKKGETAWMSN